MIKEDIEQITDIKELQRLYIELNNEIERLEVDYSQANDIIVEQSKEIERLNNNINKAIEAINVYQNEKTLSIGYEDLKRIRGILRGNEFDLRMLEEYLQELEGSDKE